MFCSLPRLRLVLSLLAVVSAPVGARAAEKAVPPVAAAKNSKPAEAGAKSSQAGKGAKPVQAGPVKQPPASPPLPPFVLRVSEAGVQRLADGTRPRAVDIAADGRWLVVEKGANRVVVHGPGADDKKVIEVDQPEDADFLPDGGLLVTSARRRAVIELDENGTEVWEFGGLVAPMDADRLANGNTLIADAKPGRVIEVDRAKKVVWRHTEGIHLPRDVEATADGNVLIADYNGHHVACIRRDGTTCWRLNHIGHPSSLQVLPDGGILVAAHKSGWLLWFDAQRRGLGHWRLGGELEDFAFAPASALLAAQAPGADSRMPDEKRLRLARRVFNELRRGAPAAAAAAPGVRVAGDVKTAKKNLVVILFDSLRRDHVPWHGYWRNTAPHLQKLADGGLVFDQYITQAPWTKPSVASLLTSTYASTHGATSQKPQSQLPESLTTIAETLWANGYYTIAMMENPHMGDRNSSKGFEQGYELYKYVGGQQTADARPESTITMTLDALRTRPADQPFFLTIFLMNPHYPYAPHRPRYGGKAAGPANPSPINDYDGEIWEADEQIGRLLAFLAESGHADDTIVVMSSDHGEEFGDHGKRFHGDTLYDCVINVPLVISGLDRVGRFTGLVREIDLMPTLLDYLGIEVEAPLAAQMAGQSVRGFLEPGVDKTGLVAYSQSRFRDNTHLISERSESRKVIADLQSGRVHVFDLVADPQEYNDIADKDAGAAELARFTAWETGLQIAEPDAGPTAVVSEEDLERLRAAGYLGD